MTHIALGTKAETLAALAARGVPVPSSMFFTVEEWRRDRSGVLHLMQSRFGGVSEGVAVRSSSRGEDGAVSSMAGAFTSVLHVRVDDAVALADAVERVIASYRGDRDDQVLVQRMVVDPVVSGVMMTRALDDGGPYCVVNYDDVSGRTDTITGGVGESKTVSIYRGASSQDFDSARLRRLFQLGLELEGVCGHHAIDIEFVVDRSETVHVLQVRPISRALDWHPADDAALANRIDAATTALDRHSAPKPGQVGRRTILGIMPDWNPAEILGRSPRPLATSLYRNLITESVWREARASMGYRSLAEGELMVTIADQPFIDVRASFNSLLPAGISEPTAALLVDAWLDRLDRHPELHDKVEFDVAITALDLSFERTLSERYPGLLSEHAVAEFRSALQRLTDRCMSTADDASLATAERHVAALAAQVDADVPAGAGTVTDMVDRVRRQLDDCREHGTRPFAVIARHSFIAESWLRSLIARGVLSDARVQGLRASIRTVSGEMSRDLANVQSGGMSLAAFLQRYGHLRPSTYDILSPRYADRAELFASAHVPAAVTDAQGPFVLTTEEARRLSTALTACGLQITAGDFVEYVQRAIVGREHAKFVFTRVLSDAIEALAAIGQLRGLSRDQVSMLTLEEMLAVDGDAPASVGRALSHTAEARRRAFQHARTVRLSYLLRSARDVAIVPQHRSAPNFATRVRHTGETVFLDATSRVPVSLTGKIVCIENADPGFDWVFTQGIAGLITKFGGANSHMAVRCAEYGLAAAIGCGELLFERIRRARYCAIDGEARSVQPLEGAVA